MCVNDVVCCGARPLFFLDYIACGKNFPEKIAQIVAGVAEGCVQSGCALIGGETAEHPGMMPEEDYDLAGFTVGVVDKKKIIDGSRLEAGDVLLGVKSSGVHSNGFSLVRKVFGIGADDQADKEILSHYYDELGATLGETLLTPTRIYVKPVLAAMPGRVTSRPSPTSPGAASTRTSPACSRRASPPRSKRPPCRVLPIFELIQAKRATSPSGICSTPSTWAWACAWPCPKTSRPGRPGRLCRRRGRGRCPGRSGGRRAEGLSSCAEHRRAGVRRGHQPAGPHRRPGRRGDCKRPARGCVIAQPAGRLRPGAG